MYQTLRRLTLQPWLTLNSPSSCLYLLVEGYRKVPPHPVPFSFTSLMMNMEAMNEVSHDLYSLRPQAHANVYCQDQAWQPITGSQAPGTPVETLRALLAKWISG